jgi:sugar lactone lactonase YvrE
MNRTFTLLLAMAAASAMDAQLVTTILDAPTQVDDALFRDPAGNLYGSHYMGSAVYRVAPDGGVTTFVGGLNTPNGIAMNGLGQFFVADNNGNRIYHVANDGTSIDTFDVINPSGLLKASDSDTILFTQYLPDKLGKLAPDGTITIAFEGAPLNGPVGLAHTDDGTLYVANYTDRKIHRVVGGTLEYVATVPGPSSGVLGFITAGGGTLYGTSWNSHAIYAIEPAYTDSVRLIAGGNGQGNTDGDVATAQFNQPNGILAVAGGDTLYVSDFGSKNIRMITGVLTGIAEQGGPELLRIVPDASGGSITLAVDRAWPQGSTCQIHDVQGRMVYSRSIGGEARLITVPVGSLSAGAYTVVLHGKGRSSVGRFAKP